MRSARRICHTLVFAALLATPSADAAHGQASSNEEVGAASTFLPPGHWSVRAVRRLAAAGLIDGGFDAGQRALRIGEIARLLESATASAAGPLADVARSYRDRFTEELRPVSSQSGLWRLRRAAVEAGWTNEEGRVLAGIGYSNVDDWTGTEPVPDDSGPLARLPLAASIGKAVGVSATPAWRRDEATLEEAHVVAELGPVGAWAGRRAVGYGYGEGGSVVLSGNVALDGIGLYLTRPARLPGFLRAIGPIRLETFGSRVENGDLIREPWFWAARAHIAPHGRLGIGFNRGAMFGGEGNAPVTLRNLFYVLVGEHGGEQGEFANQVMSLDVRWRPPLGGVPVETYVEWGFDDTSGGYHRSPGIIAGLRLAALPGVPAAELGIERASFAAASIKNTIWYRNWSLRGGWTHDRALLGHPVAGHGTEWLLFGGADLAAARVRFDARVALRDRAEENLLAPERTGKSTAAVITAEVRALPWLEVTAGAVYEDGASGWRTSSAIIAARAWFVSRTATPDVVPTTRRDGCPSCVR